MTALADVRGALVRAGADGRNRTNVGGPEPVSPDARLDRVLAIVNQSVLPWHVTCHLGGSGPLCFDAANRRLLRVSELPPRLSQAARAILSKPVLASSDAEETAAALLEILGAASSFHVTIEPQVSTGLTDQGGLSAVTLREAAGISETLCHMAWLQGQFTDLGAPDTGTEAVAPEFFSVPSEESALEIEASHRVAEWARAALCHLMKQDFPLATVLETEGILCLGYSELIPCNLVIRGFCGSFQVAQVAIDGPVLRPEGGFRPI